VCPILSAFTTPLARFPGLSDQNEVFLDVIEKLNLLVASNGTVLHSEIIGSIKMRTFLSGMPELKLGLNDKVLFEATGRGMGCDWFCFRTPRCGNA
jgi:hypothetical protein